MRINILIFAALFYSFSLELMAQKTGGKLGTTGSYVYRVENQFAGNGIGVGEPKVFDNRTLILMLEDLDTSLERLNSIDQTKVLANVGLLQGYEKAAVSRAFSISTLPVPGVDLTERRDTNVGNLVA